MPRVFLILLIALLALPAQAYNRESAIGVSVLTLLIWNPMKLDGVGFDYSEDAQFSRSRMLWLWDFDEPIARFGPISLQGHLEFAFGQTAPSPPDVSLGLTPVLEWTIERNQWQAMIETGLGGHYLSKTEHEGRQLSTHFQFGELLGVGTRYKNLQLGLRYQHLSNGDTVVPNNGYNFYGAVIKLWY